MPRPPQDDREDLSAMRAQMAELQQRMDRASMQHRQGPAPAEKRGHRFAFIFFGAIVAIIVIGIIVAASQPNTATTNTPSAPATTAPTYSVKAAGSMTKIQTVGDIVTFTIAVNNTGSTDIPHLVLWFQGIDPWTIDSQTSSCRTDEPASLPTLNIGSAWDYGSLPAKSLCDVTITMAATKVGNHDLTWSTYANVDESSGAPEEEVTGADYEWKGVINP